MRAIEINSKTDDKGYLKIGYQLDRSDSHVRVLILLEEDTAEDEEKLWMASIPKNPAFEFLHDSFEDVYSINETSKKENTSII